MRHPAPHVPRQPATRLPCRSAPARRRLAGFPGCVGDRVDRAVELDRLELEGLAARRSTAQGLARRGRCARTARATRTGSTGRVPPTARRRLEGLRDDPRPPGRADRGSGHRKACAERAACCRCPPCSASAVHRGDVQVPIPVAKVAASTWPRGPRAALRGREEPDPRSTEASRCSPCAQPAARRTHATSARHDQPVRGTRRGAGRSANATRATARPSALPRPPRRQTSSVMDNYATPAADPGLPSARAGIHLTPTSPRSSASSRSSPKSRYGVAHQSVAAAIRTSSSHNDNPKPFDPPPTLASVERFCVRTQQTQATQTRDAT